MEEKHLESLYPANARFDEIQKILNYIKEGNSCQLVGLPGVGRSNLLDFLAYNRSIRYAHLGEKQAASIHFVPVDFSEVRGKQLFDVMKFLFLSLVESLRDRKKEEEYTTVDKIFRDYLGFHDELVFFQGLKQAIDYLALEKGFTIVFLFDRFEEYIPNATTEFFTNLRILRRHAKYHFSVVFSLNRPLEEMLEPSLFADFYEFVAGHIVYMSLFDKPGVDFRLSYLQKLTGRKIPDKIIEEIIHLTGGHSKLIRLSAEAYLAHFKEGEEMSEFLLSQKPVRSGLMEIWRSLTPAEQTAILKKDFADTNIRSYFENVGVLKDTTITIPLFAEFIQNQFVPEQIEKAKIEFDEHTNTIKKGEVVLSDTLTSAEFRLLKHLLHNQDRILERQEIIQIVWQDLKSQAGITDQAVDQLIFRLRRKIEDNPNNPEHLQTVKGRGFKFTA